ncbi:hypothetical protein EJ05DRAFT_401220 [Pseudovirgaria hyperparasitica]|uniref:Inner centromere protein ARK-binding domain-containing protein n=1 Tax=Pseudovirgaria hyperparasitica TaxID=470096 RepID=A0A6A6W7A2_9PEZI|nr:uncharacterized protein EJ05DRAFT_401220 [Pseudovirgaria hyperparasitica]KAF2757786.1 hypothetical protein EJ05DRAFT_401220 [Pseudovirgaria hyperparasitica]
MAASRTKAPQVGSAQWLISETRQAEEFLEQEVEEFSFSVRNEIEWLNEHMSDVFSRDHTNFAEMLKTPGRLRGKTPRTVRKLNAETRAPLADVFAPNPQSTPSPSKSSHFYSKIAKFQVAGDVDPANAATPKATPSSKILARLGQENDGSSYKLAKTTDEMDIDVMPTAVRLSPAKKVIIQKSPLLSPVQAVATESGASTDASFVSAKERKSASIEAQGKQVDVITAVNDDDVMDLVESITALQQPNEDGRSGSDQFNVSHTTASALNSVIHHTDETQVAQSKVEPEGVRSPSDGSSPVKQIVRKSSLTFASLPAREPLAKKSVGARTSGPQRQSHYTRFTGGKSLGGSQSQSTATTATSQFSTQEDAMDWEETQPTSQESQAAEATKLHNKTSTQRLHDRINMLGQAKDRTSKVIPNTNASIQPQYPQLPSLDLDKPTNDGTTAFSPNAALEADEDEGDRIAPISGSSFPLPPTRPDLFKSHSAEVMQQISGRSSIGRFEQPQSPTTTGSPLRPTLGHSKSASASAIPSLIRLNTAVQGHKKVASDSDSAMSTVLETTTPSGSPIGKKYADGPLSASKAKFFSVLKSAKDRIIASAGISAQAKLEALSPSHRDKQISHMPSLDQIFSPKRPERAPSPARPVSPVKADEGRRTRSSTEKQREKAAKDNQRHEDNLEKARAKVRDEIAVHSQQTKQKAVEPNVESMPDNASIKEVADTALSAPPKSQLPTALPQKQKDSRRLVKPTKEAQSKQPVVVKVAMNRQFPQHQASNAALASSFQENPATSKQPQTGAKAGNDSVKPPPPATSARQKAMDIAAKKKDQAAQRRADQKREVEQKKLKQEEERRTEQQRRAAEQRALDAKRATQKQNMEARTRPQANRPPNRQVNNLASALQQEKAAHGGTHQRGDLGTTRPVSRMNTVPIPPINPAKPPKRIFQPDDDEPIIRPQIQRAPPSFQQTESKRRKTGDMEEETAELGRSVMKPPIRQSNMRKEQQNKFPQGYMPAQTPASHALLKHATSAQHQKSNHPHELAKFSNAKIPFAENPNPAGPSNSQYGQQSAFKTPVRQNGPHNYQNTAKSAKSSPAYPNSEAISLPDIPTDSEDEDSENGFEQPSWADSPALRELLIAQQLIDPETIFGPIPPLQMEEIFKNKDRHKRFRERTSSANWSGGDRLTEEEKQRDREARRRLMRDGAWSFNTTGEH